MYCEVVCALQAPGQCDLAEGVDDGHGEVAARAAGWESPLHRAEILRLRGCCADAETQILMACEELRPYLRREFGWPLTEPGRIRFRKGDIQGAEDASLAAHEAGWDPQLDNQVSFNDTLLAFLREHQAFRPTVEMNGSCQEGGLSHVAASFGSVRLASRGEGRWHGEGGDYAYLELELDEGEYKVPAL